MQNRQQHQRPTEAGLPDAADYDPTAIGTADISAGDPVDAFPEYGLELVPIIHDGADTGRRFVRRNGAYLADVSERYNLFPNERTVEVANSVAKDLGAKPFHDWGAEGDWFAKLDDHVYQDADRRRVHALYAFDEQVDIGFDDPVNVGFAVHDSIDASLSFQIGLFTFRHACANMVTMTVKDVSRDEYTLDQPRFSALDVEEERTVLAHESNYHTKGFDVDPEQLEARIQQVILAAEDVVDGYQDWVDQVATPEVVGGLIDRAEGTGQLSKKDLPGWMDDIASALDHYEENDQLDPGADCDRSDVIEDAIPRGKTMWETYNDMTESVWHDPGTDDRTKNRKFRDLHRVMQPAPTIK